MIVFLQRSEVDAGLGPNQAAEASRYLSAVFAVAMRLWWVRRGQDAGQRGRLTETQRLHPGVHGRRPPGRLHLAVLRLHVSASREMKSWFASRVENDPGNTPPPSSAMHQVASSLIHTALGLHVELDTMTPDGHQAEYCNIAYMFFLYF